MDNVVKFYEIHTVNGLTCRFKLDLNPSNGKYEPHIWHRHLIEPEQVVSAYLNLTKKEWNSNYNRYECYSETDDLHILLNYYSQDETKIMIISAFKI